MEVHEITDLKFLRMAGSFDILMREAHASRIFSGFGIQDGKNFFRCG